MHRPRHKPVNARQALVENFNRELERIVRGGTPPQENRSPEETHALRLAQKLAAVDFSRGSPIQQSLRRRLSERSIQYTSKITGINRIFFFHQGRALVGLGVTALLAFILIFGLVSPQQTSATPAYDLPAAQPGMPVVSLTVAASHSQHLSPRPVPTPMALSVTAGQPVNSPKRTPVTLNPFLGSQFPIITTTISK